MTSLFSACVIALVAVFILLGVLALLMELIIIAFPPARSGADAAVVAALSAVVAAAIPGAKVTRIEEET